MLWKWRICCEVLFSNYKIPLICAEEDVECITFTEMLQKLKISI